MTEGTKDIDRGWAWVILACATVTMFLNGFLCYSMGIITEELLEVFQEELSVTSVVGSVMIGVQNCTGPLAGVIITKVGSRLCAILGGIIALCGLLGASFSRSLFAVMWTFGVATGIGFGLAYSSSLVMVAQYFKRLRPVASGVTVSGAAFGMFVGPPTLRYLISEYRLQGTFLIVAGIASHLCVLGALMRPLPKSQELRIIKRKEKHCLRIVLNNIEFSGRSISKLFRNRGYILYILSAFCWNFAEAACNIHLPNYCIQRGSTKMQAAFLFTIMGLTNIISRLFTGFAANDERISSLTLYMGQMGLAGVCTGLFPLYSGTFVGQMCYAGFLGLYIGGANSLLNPITVGVAGLDNIAVALGVVSFMVGVGFLSGPPVAGFIVDSGRSYTESYICAATMFLLSSVLTLLIPLFHKEDVEGSVHQSREIDIPVCDVDKRLMKTEHDEIKNRPETNEEESYFL